MKTLLLLSCITATSLAGYCQMEGIEKFRSKELTKEDTVLYLWFDYNLKIFSPPVDGAHNGTDRPRIDYILAAITPLYAGNILEFVSTRRITSDTIRVKALTHKTIVTVEEMSFFVKGNYPWGLGGVYGEPYFKKLKHIYILEKALRKGFVVITPVRVSSTTIQECYIPEMNELVDDDTP